MSGWAIDLGNSHTRVARWDTAADAPRLVELRDICRKSAGDDPLESPRLVPSATHLLGNSGLTARIGDWSFVARHWFLGQQALIGRRAVEANSGRITPNFVPTFKPFLERESLRPLARVGRKAFSARDVARIFVRELLAEVKRATGERIRDVVLTAPVEAFDSYRAELGHVVRRLGMRQVRFVDEPVAAALGYGLDLGREHDVLVVDFGGGTFHMALVTINPGAVTAGRAEVLAKEGRSVGGNLVNGWLLEEFCRQAGFRFDEEDASEETRFWRALMLAEACRVKEALFLEPVAQFRLQPPAHLRRVEPQGDAVHRFEVTRDDLTRTLRERGVYQMLEQCTEAIFKKSAPRVREQDLEDVLVVGGSTLLPGIYPFFEKRFGRDRVRAWQPFEAVAYGASVLAAGRVQHADFIVHDYAFVTYDPRTHEPQYTVVVPRGTPFPTPRGFWKRRLVPTCSLGEPESLFKVVICEIGRGKPGDREFAWDQRGGLHALGGTVGDSKPLVVPLNASNPTLGRLEPPHQPRDRRPRLEVSFGVNLDRWLVATVYDLRTKKMLLEEEPVVRLL